MVPKSNPRYHVTCKPYCFLIPLEQLFWVRPDAAVGGREMSKKLPVCHREGSKLSAMVKGSLEGRRGIESI